MFFLAFSKTVAARLAISFYKAVLDLTNSLLLSLIVMLKVTPQYLGQL